MLRIIKRGNQFMGFAKLASEFCIQTVKLSATTTIATGIGTFFYHSAHYTKNVLTSECPDKANEHKPTTYNQQQNKNLTPKFE